MMCSDRREDPGRGLLLYLKEPSMKVIPADHVNQKGTCKFQLLSAGSDKNHAKRKFLSTWWSTDFSKNYRVGRLVDLLFSPNLFFSKIIALLRKSGLYF